MKWNDEKYVPILKEALEKEKSAQISNLLKAYFPAGLMVKSEGKEALEDIVRELHKGNKKRSLAWAYETSFSKVHRKDGQEADEEYLQAILLAYAIMPMKDVVSPKKGTADSKASQGGADMPDRLYQLFQEWAENSGTVAADLLWPLRPYLKFRHLTARGRR